MAKKASGKQTPSAAALRAAAAQLEEKETGKRKNTALWRLAAFLFWALAAAAMYLPDLGLEIPFGAARMLVLGEQTWCIVGIAAAAVLSIIGALIWKKANHIHPTRSHNRVVQFFWNQFGVVMAGIIMAPLAVILILKSDELDGKMKKVVAAVLLAAFLGAGAASADYHPVTQDEIDQIVSGAAGEGYLGEAYWTRYGKSYHYTRGCQALSRTTEANLFSGSLEQALESQRTDPCDFCTGGEAGGMLENLVDNLTDEDAA